MKSTPTVLKAAGLAMCLGAASSCSALAQWAPDKTVKIVVPFAPGGSADVLARLLGQQVAQTKSQPTIVENRPGGGTVLASEAVARAVPDGMTLLIVSNSFLIAPHVRTSLPFHPITSFEPICYLAYAPTLFVVQRSSPYMTLKELLDAARARPGSVTMATVGPASSPHVAVEMLKRSAKVEIVYVPFPGGTPAVTNLLGGHVTSALANYSEVQANLDKELRPLAIGATRRLETYPDVPTIAEAGFPEIEATTWFGIMAPVKTDPAMVNQITAAFKSAVESAELKSKLAAVGLVPVGSCGAEFGKYLSTLIERYRQAILAANIKAN